MVFHDANCFFVYSRLILQVKKFADSDRRVASGSISIDATIAATFKLQAYQNVTVDILQDLSLVKLDSVEMKFIDQYLSRSVMWRLKRYLANSCVYLNKPVSYCGIRMNVLEMWHQACQIINYLRIAFVQTKKFDLTVSHCLCV